MSTRDRLRVAADALRYHGSGWWLDSVLPHSAPGVIAFAIGAPAVWFAVGFALADNRADYVATPDVLFQLPFFAIHVLALRAMGTLWARGLEPALDRLALDARWARRMRDLVCGRWVNLGALAACAFFAVRDTVFGLSPDPTTGLIPFDDPAMWDFGSLGRPVHVMMLGLWYVEWWMFGYLLWLQIACLFGLSAALYRTDFSPHLARVLTENGYRDLFQLIGRSATICLVFAVANLLFIQVTGELFPRESVDIDGVWSFLTEMSDLLSTTLLFVLLVGGFMVCLVALRRSLTRAVAALFAESSDRALTELAQPLEATGNVETDLGRLRDRVEVQAGIIRAVAFQREVDQLGGKTLSLVAVKAAVPLVTALIRLLKMR